MIARITSDTIINVKGMLTEGEDGGVSETEEFVFPSFEALSSASGWCTCTPYVLPSTGRCSYMEYDPEGEETAALYEAQEIKKALEPAQPVLRDVSSDDVAVRVNSVALNSVVSVKSVKWPGAVCCLKKGTKNFSNLYVGYGHPRDTDAYGGFYPTAPPAVLDEPADIPEIAEPVAKPAEAAAPAEE